MAKIKDILICQNKSAQIELARRVVLSQNLGPFGIWSWLADSLRELPRRSWTREAHKRLWDGGLLTIDSTPANPGSVADYSSRIISAGLQVNKRVAILFPKGTDHGSIVPDVAVSWCLEPKEFKLTNRVLLVSGRAGAHRPLRHAQVGALALASVLDIHANDANATLNLAGRASQLPTVIYTSRPSNLRSLLNDVQPDVVILDLCATDRQPWVVSAMADLRTFKNPVALWTDNPFVYVLAGSTEWLRFRWDSGKPADETDVEPLRLRSLIAQQGTTSLNSLIVPTLSNSAEAMMRDATIDLVRARVELNGALAQEAASLLARFVRAMSRLSIPVAEFDDLSSTHWGVASLTALSDEVENYFKYWTDSPLPLTRAREAAQEAFRLLRRDGPALGKALTNHILEGREPRQVLFPSRSQAALFRKHFASEYGLQQGAPLLPLSPDELGTLEIEGQLLVVGLPYPDFFFKAPQVLLTDRIEVLHHEFEVKLADWVFNTSVEMCAPSTEENVHAVAQLLGKTEPIIGPQSQSRIVRTPATFVTPQGTKESQAMQLNLPSQIDAWASLLSQEELDAEGMESEPLERGGTWTSAAVEIRFSDRTWVFLDECGPVQVVTSSRMEQRPARDLVAGDQIMLINGQKRQDQFSMLLTRLHAVSGVSVYVDLVNRWRSEIGELYHRHWVAQGLGTNELLCKLRSLGTSVTTADTVRNWIRGWHTPQDRQDIWRVAVALEMPFTTQHHRAIAKAATEIANVHRQVSRQINLWLEWRLSDPLRARSAMNAEILPDLGISLADFYDAVVILDIEEIQLLDRPVPGSLIGRRQGLL
ncbi:hypothetical protein [Fimbriimonas ginsengisoli]|uniref:DISARM anti-phage system protein DrmE domain-containing protein n=1 Tax=Fimbriimonas ginsengisoli TaxID=1005039 RepID=UPI0011860B35|nr:hypothetical protein [Fimbriimonas ginsengisoli]